MFGLRKFTELEFLRAKIAEIKFEIEERKAAIAEQIFVTEARNEYDTLKAELASLK